MAVDANSVSRVASSCARQGFKPQYMLGDTIANEKQAADPNLAGALVTTATFPWSFTGSPASAEYAQALKRYAPNQDLAGSMSLAWVAGKLLEKAVANAGGDVTSPGILKGLWAMKNETLGGLAIPLTFAAEKPTPPTSCAFALRYVNGKTSTMNDGKYQC